MSVTDQDLEQLETWLDGELEDDEAVIELRRRLAVEPDLAEAHAALRADRAMRVAALAALEPGDDEAHALADRLIAVARQGAVPAPMAAGAASASGDGTLATSASDEAAAGHDDAWSSRLLWRLRPVAAAAALVVIGFGIGWIGRGTQDGGVFEPRTPAQVAVTDETGQVLAAQQFQDPRDAREFVEDLEAWRARQQRLRNANMVYTAEKF